MSYHAPERTSGAGVADWAHERAIIKASGALVAGMDEVGRGPLAGPVTAAIVVLDARRIPRGLDDSKVLSASRREELFDKILRNARAVAFGQATPAEIDRINIRRATHLAMARAARGLPVAVGHILIDGSDLPPDLPCPASTLVKGDALSVSIAAAAIVAKVIRDRQMARLAQAFPVYGFESHAGYATAAHRAAIARHGPCAHHRMSFSPLKVQFGADRDETETLF